MDIETIDDVLYRLDQIIATAHDGLHRIGYFACLYRHVTYAVKAGIAQNQFEDGPRMEKLDIAFASRYFQMLDEWSRNAVSLQSWRIAFEATRTDRPIVTQHLFLAMNPHISLDLALAAARTCPGASSSIPRPSRTTRCSGLVWRPRAPALGATLNGWRI